MCGIVGCINIQGKTMASVVRALQILQNRGYDSVGICTITDKMVVEKQISSDTVSAMDQITKSELQNLDTRIAIGHTRWATHGAKTIENCHPHFDETKRYALIHNGIIENYRELKGEEFYYGETDSEIAAKGFAKYGLQVFEKFQGTWAILVLDEKNPQRLIVAKNGSPLLMGINADKSKVMLVSEIAGFDLDIVQYAVIPDGSVDVIEITETGIDYPGYPLQSIDAKIFEQCPDPYAHWMLKEIHDQPQVAQMISQMTLPHVEKPEHLIMSACGTSLHAAMIGATYFKESQDFSVSVIDGADLSARDFLKHKDNLLIVISQSGETRDLYRALQIAKEFRVRTLGIVNVEGSLIAREVDTVIYTRAGRENAVASTKSFLAQVLVLKRLANQTCDLVDLSSKIFDATRVLSPSILDVFQNKPSCFLLGKNQYEWVAKEGALKIKEVAYIHAEGYGASALKHGPFALIEQGTPIIVLCNKDDYYPKIVNVINEVKSRQAVVIAITNTDLPDIVDHCIRIDIDPELFEMVAIIPLQLLAYQLAVYHKHNPDYPRNLAKVVTVD